jgi:hypothetical protein
VNQKVLAGRYELGVSPGRLDREGKVTGLNRPSEGRWFRGHRLPVRTEFLSRAEIYLQRPDIRLALEGMESNFAA